MAIVLHTNTDLSQLPLDTDDGTNNDNGNAVVNTQAITPAQVTPQVTQVGAANDSVSNASVPVGATDAAKTSTYTTSDPSLPNPEGSQAPVRQTAALVANTTMLNAGVSGGPISEAEMFNILQKSALEGWKLSSNLNAALTKTKVNANKAAAEDLMAQVSGEREHAKIAFGTAIAGASANLLVGYKGSQMQKAGEAGVEKLTVKAADSAVSGAANSAAKPGAASVAAQQKKADSAVQTAADNGIKRQTPDASPNIFGKKEHGSKSRSNLKPADNTQDPNAIDPNAIDPKLSQPSAASAALTGTNNGVAPDKAAVSSLLDKSSQGAAMAQAGAAVGGVIQAGGDYYDKLQGGQYQADQAKIAGKIDELNAQIAQIVVDSSKSTQDQALEALKAAQQAVQSYSQRWTEVNNNIANR